MTRTFRLAAVERLREAQLTGCARTLAQARRDVAAAGAEHDALTAALLRCVPDRRSSPQDVRSVAARRELLRERLVQVGVRRDQALEMVADTLARWTAARSRLRAVETLHDRHRQAVQRQDARRDQLELDELAVARARRSALDHPGGAPDE